MELSYTSQITFLPCRDLLRSEQFYTEVLGYTLVLDQGKCRIYRCVDSAFLGLCLREDDFSSQGCIFTVVTENVDGWADKIKQAGWPIEVEPRDNETYNIRQCFVRDPDGHLIEIQRFLHPFP